MPEQPSARMVRHAVRAMGTRFEIVLPCDADEAKHLSAVGEEALAAVLDWHRRLSRFEPSSDVSRINREAASHAVVVDPELFDLLRECERLREASRGAFDISRGGAEQLELDTSRSTVRFHDPRLALDMGGLGKGVALRSIGEVFNEHGVIDALVHGGTSSVLALGSPPGDQEWAVALGPDAGARTLRLRDRSLSLSRPDAGTAEGRSHITDPRTGRPADSGVLAAACWGLDPVECEAWSTAMVVLGEPPRAPGLGWAIERDEVWETGKSEDLIELQETCG